MSIEVKEIKRVFRYNGIELPDIPGLTPQAVRDVYSAQYPELISAEVEAGEVAGGVQEYTFRKAVGTKGGTADDDARLAALKAAVAEEAKGRQKDVDAGLAQALARRGMAARARAWDATARDNAHPVPRLRPVSEMLAPVA
ncbi:MAG: PRTRC system protein C [Azoarcus sp.]|jgi:PRTRC genetic system protein C|nr:PRTRC system protein C [Azoarcus sp.]